jgi:antitoxin (DNA-binding transcriptional repressor) of toxin-antitoxin stability system
MVREEPKRLEMAMPAAQSEPRRKARLWELWAAIGVTTSVFGVAASLLLPASSGDRVPADVDAKREAVFSTMQPIPILVATDDDERRLAESMRLPPPETEALLAVVAGERAFAAPASQAAMPAPASAGQAKAAPRPVTLTQITLWDTDAPDGDVVRILSAGYEIEVTLSKTPVALAVPVPPRGVINVVGVRDGGGGITAGIAVGGQAIELPIMSVGQTLGIPVLAKR